MTCLKCLKTYFTNHPELQDDLEGKNPTNRKFVDVVSSFFNRCDGPVEFIDRYKCSITTNDANSCDYQRKFTRNQWQSQTSSLWTSSRQNCKRISTNKSKSFSSSFFFQWEVRKEALDYLAHVYKKECLNTNWSDETQKKLTWIANCIIHLYYQKSTQDK